MKSRKARMKIRITKHKINNGRSIKPVLIKFNGRYCKLTRGNELLERVSELSVKFCLNFSCGKCISVSTTVPISIDGSFDRSFHKRWGFVQPFTEKKKKKFKGDARNENYGIIYFQASCSRLAATFPTARRYHSTGRDIKTGDQFCVWDVARTWNGSRGKIFNTPPPSILHLNFRFSFDLFEICSFFATCHTPLVKDEINGIIFSSIRVSI